MEKSTPKESRLQNQNKHQKFPEVKDISWKRWLPFNLNLFMLLWYNTHLFIFFQSPISSSKQAHLLWWKCVCVCVYLCEFYFATFFFSGTNVVAQIQFQGNKELARQLTRQILHIYNDETIHQLTMCMSHRCMSQKNVICFHCVL